MRTVAGREWIVKAGTQKRKPGGALKQRLSLLFPVLNELATETAFDAQVAVGNGDIKWRRDLHNAIVLRVKSQRAADAAIRTDRVRLLLLGFIPRAGLPHVVFRLEHQRTRGTHTDAVSTVNARGFR